MKTILSIFSNKTLEKVRSILGQSEGGIYKRIDENRELVELLQKQAPTLLALNPWIVGWLKSQDTFLNDLASAVNLDDLAFGERSDFPRPWPVKSEMTSATNQDWIQHAYPLQQITVQLQGTRHSKRENIITLTETVLERLKRGEMQGEDHDDDFGYRFNVDPSSLGPSYFNKPAAKS